MRGDLALRLHALGGDAARLPASRAAPCTRYTPRCTCWWRRTIRRSPRRPDSPNAPISTRTRSSGMPERLGRDLGHDRVGPGADVGDVRAHHGGPVRHHPHRGLARQLELHAHGGRHAVADQPPAVPQAPGLRRPALPAEPARAFAHALDQSAIAERLTCLGMDRRLVQDPQLDRVHVQRYRQLVDRRLDRQQARRLARRADVFAAGQVELRQPVPRQPVGRGVHRARRGRRLLGVLRDRTLVCMVTSWPRATIRPSRVAPSRTRWLVVGPHAERAERSAAGS